MKRSPWSCHGYSVMSVNSAGMTPTMAADTSRHRRPAGGQQHDHFADSGKMIDRE